jgi:Tfp pilus assembly protein PilF
MLLEMKRAGEAQEEFNKLLRTEPNRFAAVYGAARAAEINGDHKSAAEMYRQLNLLGANGNTDRAELKQAQKYLSLEAHR